MQIGDLGIGQLKAVALEQVLVARHGLIEGADGLSVELRQILGQHDAGAAHPVDGVLDLMRAGQVFRVRHGNRLESQFVISNVEEGALGCKIEI